MPPTLASLLQDPHLEGAFRAAFTPEQAAPSAAPVDAEQESRQPQPTMHEADVGAAGDEDHQAARS